MHLHVSGDSDAGPGINDKISNPTKGWTASALQTIWTMTIKTNRTCSLLDMHSYYKEIMSLQEKYKGRFP